MVVEWWTLGLSGRGVTGSYTTRLGSNLGAKTRCIWDQRATYSNPRRVVHHCLLVSLDDPREASDQTR